MALMAMAAVVVVVVAVVGEAKQEELTEKHTEVLYRPRLSKQRESSTCKECAIALLLC
jgi:hypothetical protein